MPLPGFGWRDSGNASRAGSCCYRNCGRISNLPSRGCIAVSLPPGRMRHELLAIRGLAPRISGFRAKPPPGEDPLGSGHSGGGRPQRAACAISGSRPPAFRRSEPMASRFGRCGSAMSPRGRVCWCRALNGTRLTGLPGSVAWPRLAHRRCNSPSLRKALSGEAPMSGRRIGRNRRNCPPCSCDTASPGPTSGGIYFEPRLPAAARPICQPMR